MNRDTALRWTLFAALAALITLAWWNGLQGEFTYDDKVEVVGNRAIRAITRWRTMLAYNANRPLVLLTWALDWRLWGQDPLGYHAVNVGIHVLNAGLAMLLGEEIGLRLGRRRPLLLGAAAALLWCVHPMTTEAVTYVTGRSESLCSLFLLAGCLEWLRWRRTSGQVDRGESAFHLFFCYASFLLAAVTKELAAVLPLLLVLLEACLPSPRRVGWRVVTALAPFAATLALAATLRKVFYGYYLTDLWIRPIPVQVATSAEVVFQYLRLWFLPVGQSIFHDHPAAPWPPDLPALAALVGVAFLAVGAVAARRRLPVWTLGVMWFLVLLAPTTSFVPLRETMAEHRSYLAGWGLVTTCVFLADTVLPRIASLRFALALGLAIPLTVATTLRNHLWGTEVRLWQQASTHNPASAEAVYGYGDALRFAGQYDEAVTWYRKVIEMDADYLDAWNNLGIALAEQGKGDEAAAVWLEVLRRHPTYCKAHNNLGWLHYRREAWEDAIAEFRATLAWCPEDVQAHYALGNIYFGPRRDVTRAQRHYEATLTIDPQFARAEQVRKRLLELTW